MIVRFNERALATMGFDQASISALRHLLRQTGNQLGATTLPDLVDGAGQETEATELHAAFAELRKEFRALRIAVEATAGDAERAELRKRLRDLDIERAFPPPQTDWEHPGKIGDKTPNAVAATVLTANTSVTLNPTTPGTVDNVTIGATTARPATVTTLTSTVATGTPPLTVASSTQVPNLYAARAASADSAAGLSSPHTFPADATDLPTVITLANALKAAAVAKGL